MKDSTPKRSDELVESLGQGVEYFTAWAASFFGDSSEAAQRFRRLAARTNREGAPLLERLSLERAIALAPTDVRPRIELGTLLVEQGELKEAREAFEGALSCDHSDKRALQGMATTLHRLGEASEAAYFYLSYLTQEPDDLNALINLAIVFDSQGQYDAAIERLQKAQALNPGNALIQQLLGRSLMRAGRLSEAREELNSAVEIAPQESEVHRYLGLVAESLEERPDARLSFEKAVECDKANAYAQLNLAQFLNVEDVDHKQALAASQRAAELFEAEGNEKAAVWALWEVGWAEYRLRSWQKSAEASLAALSLDPEAVPIRFNAALALLRQGEVDQARTEYGAALAKLTDLSDLRTHGVADLREALLEDPDLEGGAELLQRLETKDDEMTARIMERTEAFRHRQAKPEPG